MKLKLSLSVLFLILVGCSTHKYSNVYESKLSRTTASEKISEVTAIGRIKIVKKHIETLFKTIKKQGNPRYYLLENFLNQTSSTIKELINSNNVSLNDEVFIPENRDVALKFTRIVAAYEVMAKAGIYLSFNKLLPVESEDADKNFITLDKAMAHYQDELKRMNLAGTVIKIEDLEKEKSRQVKELLIYLVSRIESYYEEFFERKRERKMIARYISSIRDLKTVSEKQLSQKMTRLMNKKNWKKVEKLLANLDLPEVSSIDGSDEAFEKVMSVQESNTLINEVAKMYLNRE